MQVAFHAEHAGVYMAKVNIIASPVVTDESTLSGNEMYPNVVHIEGIAELPDIEVRVLFRVPYKNLKLQKKDTKRK